MDKKQNIFLIMILGGFVLFVLVFVFFSRTASGISIPGIGSTGFSVFGGRITSIVPIVVNLFCPANVGFIVTIGPPKSIVANLPTITPPLVKNGPARTGAWAIGLTTPGAKPCLPIIYVMGVSK